MHMRTVLDEFVAQHLEQAEDQSARVLEEDCIAVCRDFSVFYEVRSVQLGAFKNHKKRPRRSDLEYCYDFMEAPRDTNPRAQMQREYIQYKK